MEILRRHERGRAIVIGGSMAGLLTARTLADHFGEVLLVERDELSDVVEYRRGVPQSHHTHALLASGGRVLESLFPGISTELVEGGATKGDVALVVGWFLEGAALTRCATDLEGFAISRPLLERIVRARVRNLSNVRFRDGTNVGGLSFVEDGRRVIGVRTENETLPGDLVVDASGRGSRSPQWLEEYGYERPREEKIGVELRYTTRLFRSRPNDLGGDTAFIAPPTPSGKRGGVIILQEGGRWIVTLITHFGDYAPAELDGFIEFARTLPASAIYDVVRDAEPIGEAQTIRFPASVRHRYEYLKRFPGGYLVLGDALSSFNPIYGQGMSAAALQVTELSAVLRENPHDLARYFFRRAAKAVDAAWSIAAGNDLRMPEATGRRDVAVRFINWYVARLQRAAHHDPILSSAFLKVSNLIEPPPSLMHPSLMWRVLRSTPARAAKNTGNDSGAQIGV